MGNIEKFLGMLFILTLMLSSIADAAPPAINDLAASDLQYPGLVQDHVINLIQFLFPGMFVLYNGKGRFRRTDHGTDEPHVQFGLFQWF